MMVWRPLGLDKLNGPRIWSVLKWSWVLFARIVQFAMTCIKYLLYRPLIYVLKFIKRLAKYLLSRDRSMS